MCPNRMTISMIDHRIVDAYMWLPMGEEIWGALEAKFGVSDAGSKLSYSRASL